MNDTAPLPPPPPPYRPHGAGPSGAPDGAPFGTAGGPPPGPPPRPPYPPMASHLPPRRGRTGFAAGVVAAALVCGGGAGVAGAATWTHFHPDSSTTSATGFQTSAVVDAPKAQATDGSVEAVAAKVLPSVVEIDVSGSQGAGSGSGIILSSDGEILTNNHVVELAKDGGSINVLFNDGSHAPATIKGTDPLTDTALIQASGVSGLTPATIGKSGDLAVGQGVVAVGSPYGLESTVTSGIVSALARPVDVGSDSNGNTTTYPAIQTDAAINPGNSGGPLVDLNGDVVGIDASIRTADSTTQAQAGSIGLGFAIPIDEVMPIVQQMAAGQTPTHAKMGVQVGNAGQTDGQGNPFLGSDANGAVVEGAKIADVNAGSTAADAGLQKGDVITKVDDHQVVGADSLVATIRSYRPGDKVRITFLRGGQEKTTSLTLDSDAQSSSS